MNIKPKEGGEKEGKKGRNGNGKEMKEYEKYTNEYTKKNQTATSLVGLTKAKIV